MEEQKHHYNNNDILVTDVRNSAPFTTTGEGKCAGYEHQNFPVSTTV